MMLASPIHFSVPTTSLEDPLEALLRSPLPSIAISSCSQEACLSTFDWSDFPAIVESSFSLLRGNNYSSSDTVNSTLPKPSYSSQQTSNILSLLEVKPLRKASIPRCRTPPPQPETLLIGCRSTSKASARRPITSHSAHVSNEAAPFSFPTAASLLESSPSSPIKQATTSVLRTCLRSGDKSNKRVKFSDFVQVRTHKVTLGDHPCCPGGMALACDWEVAGNDVLIDFEVFETASLKRRQGALRLTVAERRGILQAATGLSASDLLQREYDLVFGCFDGITFGCTSELRASPSVQRALSAAQDLYDCRDKEQLAFLR